MTGSKDQEPLQKKVLCIYLIMFSILLTMSGCGRIREMPTEPIVFAKGTSCQDPQETSCVTAEDHTHVWVLQEAHSKENPEEVIEMYGCYCGQLIEVKP